MNYFTHITCVLLGGLLLGGHTGLTQSLAVNQPGKKQHLTGMSRLMADQTISGRVTDGTNGNGLPGVSVVVKGTSRGTTTDGDGNYRVNAPDQAGACYAGVFLHRLRDAGDRGRQ